jgi:hypothetical protein
MDKGDIGKIREKLFEFNARIAASHQPVRPAPPSSVPCAYAQGMQVLSLSPAEYETLSRVFAKFTVRSLLSHSFA